MPARGQALGAVVLALSLAPCRAQLVGTASARYKASFVAFLPLDTLLQI